VKRAHSRSASATEKIKSLTGTSRAQLDDVTR
jgi:hypothetical protein